MNSAAATEAGMGLKIVGLSPDFPAAQAGLLEGDIVLEFDDLDVTGLYYEEIPILNSVGVTSKFKIQRGEQVLEAEVKRVARAD